MSKSQSLVRDLSRHHFFLSRSRRAISGVAAELLMALICFGILLFQLREPLIFGTTTYDHDNLYWNLPLFHFFSEQLHFGSLPLWNPFSHGGEPFYPAWGACRMGDPSALFFSYVAQLFTSNSVLIYNWTKILQLLFYGLGTYLCLRPFSRYLLTRLTLIPIFFLSAYVLGSLRQDGILSQFGWLPFVVLMIFRILFLRRYHWANFVILGALIGVNWQTYHFVTLHFTLLVLVLGIALFYRKTLLSFLKSPRAYLKLTLASGILVLMMAPSALIFTETGNFVFPARMVEVNYENRPPMNSPLQYEGGPANVAKTSLRLPYSMILYSGSFGTVADFVQMAYPRANELYYPDTERPWRHKFRTNSEALLYIGLLPWLLTWVGILWGRSRFKKLGLFFLSAFGLYFLGGNTEFFRALHLTFPPSWFLRHTHLTQAVLISAFLFFFVLGMNRALDFLFSSRRKWFESLVAGPCAKGWNNGLLLFALTLIATFATRNVLGKGAPYNAFLLAWIVVALSLIRSNLKSWFLFLLVITSIALGCMLTRRPLLALENYGLHLFIPILIYLSIPAVIEKLKSQYRARALGVALISVLAIVVLDLQLETKQARAVYAGNPTITPEVTFNLGGAEYSKPTFARMKRQPQLCMPFVHRAYLQSIRYPETYLHTPSAFSPAYSDYGILPCTFGSDIGGDQDLALRYAYKEKRWSSFLLPKRYFEFIHLEWPLDVLKQWLFIDQLPLAFFANPVAFDPVEFNKVGLKQLSEADLSLLSRSNFVSPSGPSTDLSTAIQQVRSGASASQPFSYEVLDYTYDQLTVKVQTPKAGFLLWGDGFDRHWHAEVDTRPAVIHLTNGLFKSVEVPAGNSTVRFWYRPILLLWSIGLYYALFCIAMMVAVFHLIRFRKINWSNGR